MLLSLVALGGMATGDAAFAAPAAPLKVSAPAALDSASEMSRSLLARRDFEELGLKLIGVANLGGKSNCFVRIPGSASPQSFEPGDKVGAFRVAAIESDRVTFERDSISFQLALGGDSAPYVLRGQGEPAPALDDAELAADPVQSLQQAIDDLTAPPASKAPAKLDAIKSTGSDLKSRTSNFKSAKVIDDAWDPRLSKRPASPIVIIAGGSSNARSSSKVLGDASPHPAGAPDFAYPIKGKLTSEYGYRRYPLGGGSRMHNGVDLAAPSGTTIYAAADGVVEQVGYNSGLGRFVYIRHVNGFQTRYGHMSAQLVQEGQVIKQGDPVGREGSTGESTGPHLHFEIRQDGRPLNPLYYLGN